MKTTSGVALYGIAAVAAFTVSYGDVTVREIGATARRAHESWVFEERYTPVVSPFANGEEVVMVYVGRRYCAPSNAMGLPQQVEDIKAALHTAATVEGAGFRAIGVAIDASVEDGFGHLEKFGRFDEVRVGGGAVSDAAMEFLWQKFPGEVATPQIIVLRRTRASPKDVRSPLRYRVDGPEEVERMIGLDGIGSWLDAWAAQHPVAESGGGGMSKSESR